MANHGGHEQGSAFGLEVVVPFAWNAVNLLVTQPVFTASRRWKVVDIRGRVLVAGLGGACTFTVNKAPSGTTFAGGTTLHTGSFNVVGTADGNQTLTLGSDATVSLAVGDSVGVVLTGVPTGAIGVGAITLVPA